MSKHQSQLLPCTLSLVCLAWGCSTGQLFAQAGAPRDTPPPPDVPIITVTTTTVTAPAPAPTPPPPPRFRTFAEFATTPAQLGIAQQLDAMGKKPGTDLAGILDTLSHLPAGQVGPALTQLSPAGYDADTAAAMAAAHRHLGLISSFIEDSIADDVGPWSLWAAGLNGTDDGPQADSSARTSGGAGGADYHFGRNIRFGFAFGYSRTDIIQPGTGSRSQMDAANYGSYLTWKFAQGYVEAIFSMVEESFTDQREINFGQLDRFAASQHDGRGGSGYLGTGYDLNLAGIRLRPNAALEYGRFHQQAFTEAGAGSLNLALDDQTDDSLQSHVGLRADYDLKLPAVTVTPRATVAWGHQFDTDPRNLQASFAQGGSAPFTVQGESSSADGLETSAGFSAALFGVHLYADYALTFAGSSGMAHSLQAGLWTKF
jgi:outer membrane autotransporter protein